MSIICTCPQRKYFWSFFILYDHYPKYWILLFNEIGQHVLYAKTQPFFAYSFSHFFSFNQKEREKNVNLSLCAQADFVIKSLNSNFVKLMMLWATGPRSAVLEVILHLQTLENFSIELICLFSLFALPYTGFCGTMSIKDSIVNP